MEAMINEGRSSHCYDSCWEYVKVSLIFVFGNPFMFTIKYFQFFCKNKIIENDCVNTFFKYMNLFVNILTSCSIFYIYWFALCFLIFFPSIFPCYFSIIYENWSMLIDSFDIDEVPIAELTVRGRGY